MNNVTRVDAGMQVGQLSETVTVSAETPLLQTDRAEVRSELKARELVNLPVSLNRNYQYLFRVLPGFTPPAEAHSVPSNPSRANVLGPRASLPALAGTQTSGCFPNRTGFAGRNAIPRT